MRLWWLSPALFAWGTHQKSQSKPVSGAVLKQRGGKAPTHKPRAPKPQPIPPEPIPPEISVVSHHKSGTVASWQLSAALCCKMPAEAMYDGSYARRWAACQDTCAASGIYVDATGDFGLNWANPRRRDRVTFRTLPAVPSRWYGMSNKTLIHFVRHPVDMVLSGYFYHKRCSEHHWTSSWHFERWWQYFPPKDQMSEFYEQSQKLKVEGGFCGYLKKVPEKRGIEAEVARTLGCVDGVRNMVDLFAEDRLASNNTVVTICLSKIDPGQTPREELLAYWRGHLEATVPAVDLAVFESYLVTRDQAAKHATNKPKKNIMPLAAHALMTLLARSSPSFHANLARLAAACPSTYGTFAPFGFVDSELEATNSSSSAGNSKLNSTDIIR